MTLWPITRRTFAGMAILGAGSACLRHLPPGNAASALAEAPGDGPGPAPGATVATPEDFGAVGDLQGDAGTDNTEAFRRIGAWLDATGGRLVLNGRYRISGGFAVHRGTMEFIGDAIIRNTTIDRTDYWKNTCIFIGTYFGYGPANSGINTEAGYNILDIGAGESSVRFENAADAKHFQPGAMFYTTDSNFYRNDKGPNSPFAKASHASVVVANSGAGTITLKDSAPFAITSNAGVRPQARTDAGGFSLPGRGVPGTVPRLAKKVTIINGAFESANARGSQVVHIACHDCDLDFRWISGRDCVGANPVTDSRIAIRNAVFTDKLFELAYHHHRVEVPEVRGKRTGSIACATVAIVAVSEYGNGVTIGDIDIADYHVAGDYKFRTAIYLSSPLVKIRTVKIAGVQYCGLAIGSNGQRADRTSIESIKISGSDRSRKGPNLRRIVQIDADNVEIDKVDIDRLDNVKSAVYILPNSGKSVRVGSAIISGRAGLFQNIVNDLRRMRSPK